ncbi:zinc-binding alcohol dehydrogenase family protein [Dactylosporangium sp. NPDC051541]|uniref:zinc-binding alcohol dehydrogenase family protein n=1 Tax=Dactylosporangium sp. NPDC051541 TaxID=3363977 RepID=UPI0037A3DB85
MRAFVLPAARSTPVFAEVAAVPPADDEVTVRVEASSVNAFDLAVLDGRLRSLEHRYPVILGRDFAGVVTAAGAGVRRFAAGDRVFGMTARPYVGDGAFCEQLTVPAAAPDEATWMAALPDPIGMQDGGALATAAVAAVRAVTAMRPRPGWAALVVGASGGVGSYAVQLLARAGARVTAVTRTERGAAHLRDLGVHDVLTEAPAGRDLRYDVVLHLGGEVRRAAGCVVPGGRLVSLLHAGPADAGRPDVDVRSVLGRPDLGVLNDLAQDVAAGRLAVPRTDTFAFADLPAALRAVRAGTPGKVSVRMGKP